MPVVTVTRQIGSEGDAIGRALAERLGFRFLDRMNLVETMRAYGAEVEPTAPEIQEKQPTFWERLNEERRRHTIMLRSAVYSPVGLVRAWPHHFGISSPLPGLFGPLLYL